MRIIVTILCVLWSTLAAAQGTNFQTTVLQPLHAGIHAAFPPGGQVTLSTLQTQLRVITSTAQSQGQITSAQQTTLNTQIGSGGTAGSILTNPPTAASLRSVLLNMVSDGVGADNQTVITNEINGVLASSNTIGISADSVRQVLKDLSWYMLKWNIGANMPGLVFYQGIAMYSDIMLNTAGNSGVWDCDSGCSGASAVDATGGPSCSSCAVHTLFPSVYPSGSYTLYWEGTGSVNSCTICGSISSSSSSCTGWNGSATTCHTATVTITQQVVDTVNAENAYFATLSVTPPIANVHFTAPISAQYHNANTGTCTTGGSVPYVASPCMWLAAFANQLMPLTTLRFMDAQNAYNTYAIVNWNNRTWPNPTAAGLCIGGSAGECTAGSRDPASCCSVAQNTGGIAFEDIINLANTLNKDVWIHIHIASTDEYVCRVGRLFAFGETGYKDDPTASSGAGNCSTTAAAGAGADGQPVDTVPLNSNLHVYVELGDEVWNSGLAGWVWTGLYCFANGAPPGGSSCPMGTTTTSKLAAAQKALSWWSTSVTNGGDNTGTNASFMADLLTWRNYQVLSAIFTKRGTLSQLRNILNDQSGGGCPQFQAFGTYSSIASGAPLLPASGYLWNVVSAPYFATTDTQMGLAGPTNTIDSTSVAAIFSDLESNVLITSGSWSLGNGGGYTNIDGCVTGTASYSVGYGGTYEGGQAFWGGGQSNFTGSITGTTLTVTAISNPNLAVGTLFQASGWTNGSCQSSPCLTADTVITALVSGSGGNGTYTINNSQTFASGTLTAYWDDSAQITPGMFGVYLQNYQTWDSLVGRKKLYTHYAFAGNNCMGCVLDVMGTWISQNTSWGMIFTGEEHGSYKYDAVANLSCKAGDVNCDGIVNYLDCQILMGNLGQTNSQGKAVYPQSSNGMWWMDGDLNADGKVDSTDLAILNTVIEGAQCP